MQIPLQQLYEVSVDKEDEYGENGGCWPRHAPGKARNADRALRDLAHRSFAPPFIPYDSRISI